MPGITITATTLRTEIPIYRGTLAKPELEPFCAEFMLARNEEGLFQQCGDISDVVSMYSDSEYTFMTTLPGHSKWGDALAQERLSYLRKHARLRDANILEVGAGNTWTAKYLVDTENAAHCTVVDPALTLEETGSHPKVSIFSGYFPEALPERKQFDICISFNCLEHVPDPGKILCDMRSSLKDDGLLVLSFPDVTQKFMTGDIGVFLHEHLSYFMTPDVEKLRINAGYEVLDLTSKNDSFFVTLKKSDKKMALKDDRTIDLQKFEKSINSINALLRGFLRDGKKLVFHGAGSGLCNLGWILRNSTDISSLQIVDSDTFKRNRYLPGFSRPIMQPDDLSLDHDMIVVVTVPTFWKPIREYWLNMRQLPSDKLICLWEQQTE